MTMTHLTKAHERAKARAKRLLELYGATVTAKPASAVEIARFETKRPLSPAQMAFLVAYLPF